MTTFDDLKSQWEGQKQPELPQNGARQVIAKIHFIKRKQRIANRVLITTIFILIGFYFYIHAYKHMILTVGLLLMIGTLLIRVGIEFFSIKKLKQINVTKDAAAYKADMIVYYKKRIRTHYIATPIIILIYAIGFIVLLPSFKENLSKGFYTYILVSSICILFLLLFFISKHIKNELRILKQISN